MLDAEPSEELSFESYVNQVCAAILTHQLCAWAHREHYRLRLLLLPDYL